MQEQFNDIFRYEVENSGRRNLIKRNDFWTDLYQERIEETKEFMEFINSNTSLLFITGLVGTGKSTFVRAFFEKHQTCTGLIIDFKGHVDEFDKGENRTNGTIETAIFKIIGDSVLRLLKENIKYRLISKTEEYCDFHYNPSIELGNINKEEWESPFWEYQTNIELFLLCMEYMHDDKSISNFVYSKSIVPTENTTKFREKCLDIVKKDTEVLKEFADLLDWKKCLELIRKISDYNKPFLIVFDNVDAIKFSKIQRHLLDALINTSNITNNSKSDGRLALLNPPPVKIVLPVRDENVTRLNLSGAGTQRCLQITLNEDCKKLDYADEKKYIKKSKDFFYSIIKSRLSKIEEIFGKEKYKIIKDIIYSHILDIENSNLKRGDEFLNVKEISNESIRLMLDLISDLSFNISSSIDEETDDKMLIRKAKYFVQGKFVHFLWNFDTTNKIIKAMSKSLQQEIDYNSFCCSFRLCLTFIHNQQDKKLPCTFSDLVSKLNDDLGIGEIALKKTIFKLYNSGVRESEIISIYQYKLITKPKHITSSSEIKLNIKGEQFLYTILKHLDFFGRVTLQKHGIENKCLFELPPKKAIKYLNSIFNFVSELWNYHEYFLSKKIYPQYATNGVKFPFDKFKDFFCFGEGLYLERTCNGHLNLIKMYIVEVLKGTNGFTWYSKDEKIEFDIYNYTYLKNLPNDFELKKIINEVNNKEINDIFEIVGKYEALLSSMLPIKRKKNIVESNI